MNQPSLREMSAQRAKNATVQGVLLNCGLGIIKLVAGTLGNSFALVADGIESFADLLGSIVVFMGLTVAARPPSERHPYGRGRAEAIAAALVAVMLVGAAIGIANHAIGMIRTPHKAPEPYTLVILLGVVLAKEWLFRRLFRVGEEVTSIAVKTDAWHHRSDAITSAAAFVGIAIALVSGPGFESADDWAALMASILIGYNGISLIRPALSELTDAAPSGELVQRIRGIAESVPGVRGTHRCWIRKMGFDHFVDLDVLVDGEASVRHGHDIAHAVYLAIQNELPMVSRVFVHVEPDDEYGRHKLSWESEASKEAQQLP